MELIDGLVPLGGQPEPLAPAVIPGTPEADAEAAARKANRDTADKCIRDVQAAIDAAISRVPAASGDAHIAGVRSTLAFVHNHMSVIVAARED